MGLFTVYGILCMWLEKQAWEEYCLDDRSCERAQVSGHVEVSRVSTTWTTASNSQLEILRDNVLVLVKCIYKLTVLKITEFST